MPFSSCLPPEEERTPGKLVDPEIPVHVSPVDDVDSVWSGVAPQAALGALVSNKNALEATGMDSESLHKRLSVPWTAESALKDCKANCRTAIHVYLSPIFVDSHGTTV
jgi:hypothetical protein